MDLLKIIFLPTVLNSKKCLELFVEADDNTLLLIDELGTGSDPELGGALAESFSGIFLPKKIFAIITTHYTNIKLVVEQLPNATNAAILFDEYSSWNLCIN